MHLLEADLRQVQLAGEALVPLFAKVARLRRELHEEASPERKRELQQELEANIAEANRENAAHDASVRALIRQTGIPEEEWDAMDEANRKRNRDPIDRIRRATVRESEFAPTGNLEELIPSGIDFLRRNVPNQWLDNELARGPSTLGLEYLEEPLVVVRGMRVKSEFRTIHRLALSIKIAEDLLRKAPDFDWHAGALLIPQVAALGRCVDPLRSVEGEVEERIRSLWHGASDMVDSTMYELFVAASCAREGRRVEFLTATQSKTPDLRVHDLWIPLSVECKRRARILPADLAENSWAEALYPAARRSFVSRDLTGTIALRLSAPFEQCNSADLEDAARRIRLKTGDPKELTYPWGTLTYSRAPRRIPVATTGLYSPNYLRDVFGWNTDLPGADGIVCQASTPRTLQVGESRDPFAITWTQDEPKWIRQRVRSVAALLGSAIQQIPTGEAGIFYLCYQEADREEIADARLTLLKDKLEEWAIDRHVHSPILIVSRLIPRALGDGSPDLVDTGIQFMSETMGDPSWFELFPSAVVTGGQG